MFLSYIEPFINNLFQIVPLARVEENTGGVNDRITDFVSHPDLLKMFKILKY